MRPVMGPEKVDTCLHTGKSKCNHICAHCHKNASTVHNARAYNSADCEPTHKKTRVI